MTSDMEIIAVTQELINAINRADYETYRKFCDDDLTCFEPEALGNMVEGLAFHKFYFDNVESNETINSTMVNPKVHILADDAACIAYVRLTQLIDKQGQPRTLQSEETRVWRKRNKEWKCVHLHRSCSRNLGSMTLP